MAMEENKRVVPCSLFEKLNPNGWKPQPRGPDGLFPGWVMGSSSISTDKNGVKTEGPCKVPVPMYCVLCGTVCDHWPDTCTNEILPEIKHFIKACQNPDTCTDEILPEIKRLVKACQKAASPEKTPAGAI